MDRHVRLWSKTVTGDVLEYIEFDDWVTEVRELISALRTNGEKIDLWEGLVLVPDGRLVPASGPSQKAAF